MNTENAASVGTFKIFGVKPIEVGSISNEKFEAIRRGVYRDPLVWVAQGFNILWVCYRLCVSLLIALPSVLLIFALLLLYLDPETLRTLAQAGVDDLQQYRFLFFWIFVCWAIIFAPLAALFSPLPGYRNMFEITLRRRLLKSIPGGSSLTSFELRGDIVQPNANQAIVRVVHIFD